MFTQQIIYTGAVDDAQQAPVLCYYGLINEALTEKIFAYIQVLQYYQIRRCNLLEQF